MILKEHHGLDVKKTSGRELKTKRYCAQ